MENIIIIGGGISGLYTAYHLLKKKKYNILIIEKEKEIGGRLFTEKVEIENETYFLEGGAGVLRDDDKLLIELLNELKININYWNNKTTVIYNNKANNEVLKFDYQKIIEDLCKNSLNQISFIDLLNENTKISKKEKIGTLIGTTYSELFNANSKNICKNNDFYEFLYENHHKFGKPRAWTDLTENILKQIEILGGKIIISTSVKEISSNYIITNKNDIFHFDKIIITCPYHYFEKIKIPKSLDSWKLLLQKYHEEIDYLRVYSYFEKPLIINTKIATNLSIRRIIPLNEKLIMTVYTDGKDATKINKLCKNKKELDKYIRNELSLLLETEIPKIEKNWCYYWKKGISYWKPSHHYVSDIVKIVRHPLQNIFFCGDTYSEFPGWIESALESCKYVIDNN
jgi:hypothetical protein